MPLAPMRLSVWGVIVREGRETYSEGLTRAVCIGGVFVGLFFSDWAPISLFDRQISL